MGTDDGKQVTDLRITEIYQSIQGESSLVGVPCTFIRLTGCPLRCRWCDTAYGFEGGQTMQLTKVLEEVKALGPSLVELTGGEPLAQPAAITLMVELLSLGYEVMIETGGSEPIADIPDGVHIVMDLKCPDSGMQDRNRYENLSHLKKDDDLKFVVASRSDFDWAVEKAEAKGLFERCNVLVSPAWGLVDPQDLVEWVLQSKLPFRLNLQIHKYIWSPRKKGV